MYITLAIAKVVNQHIFPLRYVMHYNIYSWTDIWEMYNMTEIIGELITTLYPWA